MPQRDRDHHNLIVAAAHVHIDKWQDLRGNDRTPSFRSYAHFINEAYIINGVR